MTRDQREIHRKKRILEYAERIGNVREKLGLDLHLAYMDLGGLPSSLLAESVDAYAFEVAPKVRNS